MKTKLLTLALLFAGFTTFAQVKAPAPSPGAKLTQTVGLTEVSVEYSRPGMKGREIFGDLVPYDAMWRTGANKNTIVSFEHDVKVNGTDVKAGDYAIFTKPNPKEWTVYLYTDTENWGTPEKWDDAKVAAKIAVSPNRAAEKVESMRFSFENITNTGADLVLAWDLMRIPIHVETAATEMTMASIDRALAGPGYNDYYQAAKFYRTEGKDLKKATEWINRAVELAGPDKFWVMREQSLILAEAGDKKGAIAAAQKSLESAQKAGNMDYVRMNENSIKEWKSMR